MAGLRDKLGILIPFRPPSHMRDYQSIEMEARERNMDPWAVRAWRDGMVFLSIALLGLPLGWFSQYIGGNGETMTVNIWNLFASRTVPEALGLGAGLFLWTWMWSIGMTLLAHHGSRAVVDILSYTISVQPGHIIRHYAVTRGTRLVLFLEAVLFSVIYGFLMYESLKGYFLFLLPFNVDIPRLVLVALGLFWFGAFVFFPAVKYEPSDDRALGRYVVFKSITVGQKRVATFLEDAFIIAAPHVAIELVEQIRAKGIAAIYDWNIMPPESVAKMAQLFHMSNNVLNSYSNVRLPRNTGGGSYIGLEDSRGRTTIVDVNNPPGWLRANEGEPDGQQTD